MSLPFTGLTLPGLQGPGSLSCVVCAAQKKLQQSWLNAILRSNRVKEAELSSVFVVGNKIKLK